MSQRLVFDTFLKTLRTGFEIDRCVIVQRTPDTQGPQWQVTSDASNDLTDITDTNTVLQQFKQIPHRVIETVLHTAGVIVVNSPLKEHPFTADPYWLIHGPTYFICLPLRFKSQLLGAVYLESRIEPDDNQHAWSNEQIDLVKGICAQFCISLFYQQGQKLEPAPVPAAATRNVALHSHTAGLPTALTFQQLVEHANDIIFMLTIDGRFSYLSPKFKDLVGATPEAYINQSFTEIIHPEDTSRIYHTLQLQLQNREQITGFEFRLRRRDGSYIWAAANNSAPIEDEYGNFIGFQGIVRDINHRKLAEQELQQTKARLQFLISTTPAIIHSISLSGDYSAPHNHKITFISDNIAQILGYPIDKLGDDLSVWTARVHPEDIARVWQLYNQAIETHSACQAEYRLKNQSGEYQWLYSAIKILVNHKGQPIEAVGYTADITDRKCTEEQLIKTNEQLLISNSELARATRLKDEFLANMSHELRTPLNSILGISEAMLDEFYGPLSQEYRRSLQIVEQSGTHLLELINDILDLAKIEAGKLELKPCKTSLKHLCESSLSFIRQIALNKRIQVVYAPPHADFDLYLDERRMRQVLINLLSNAVKFTPNGGQVELTAQYDDALAQFQFQVRDTGIGIDSEYIAQLFQPFIQIDSSLSRQFSGTGLGLTLVKRIVNLHQGTISVESQLEMGSCFTINLPITPSKPARTSPLKNPPQRIEQQVMQVVHTNSPLVLLAEDNAMNIEIMTDYLHAQGYKVLVAKNGLEAIALNQQHQPNLILMDIQMPQMNGLDATRQIRQASSHQDVPIIALTALAMPGDAERCINAGANDYLSKPVKLKQLANLVEQHLTAGVC